MRRTLVRRRWRSAAWTAWTSSCRQHRSWRKWRRRRRTTPTAAAPPPSSWSQAKSRTLRRSRIARWRWTPPAAAPSKQESSSCTVLAPPSAASPSQRPCPSAPQAPPSQPRPPPSLALPPRPPPDPAASHLRRPLRHTHRCWAQVCAQAPWGPPTSPCLAPHSEAKRSGSASGTGAAPAQPRRTATLSR